MDAERLHQTLKLRPGSKKARQHWSAAINLVTRDVLEPLHRKLREEKAQELQKLLSDPGRSSREVLNFWRVVADVENAVEGGCRAFESRLEKKQRLEKKEKRKFYRLRKKLAREIQLEDLPRGPVRFFKEYPVVGAGGG